MFQFLISETRYKVGGHTMLQLLVLLEKALRNPRLVQEKRTVTRGGTTFQMTVWVDPRDKDAKIVQGGFDFEDAPPMPSNQVKVSQKDPIKGNKIDWKKITAGDYVEVKKKDKTSLGSQGMNDTDSGMVSRVNPVAGHEGVYSIKFDGPKYYSDEYEIVTHKPHPMNTPEYNKKLNLKKTVERDIEKFKKDGDYKATFNATNYLKKLNQEIHDMENHEWGDEEKVKKEDIDYFFKTQKWTNELNDREKSMLRLFLAGKIDGFFSGGYGKDYLNKKGVERNYDELVRTDAGLKDRIERGTLEYKGFKIHPTITRGKKRMASSFIARRCWDWKHFSQLITRSYGRSRQANCKD